MPTETRTRTVLADPGECVSCPAISYTLVDPSNTGATGFVEVHNVTGGCPGCEYHIRYDSTPWQDINAALQGNKYNNIPVGAHTMHIRCGEDDSTIVSQSFTIPAANLPQAVIQYRNQETTYPSQGGGSGTVRRADVYIALFNGNGSPQPVSNLVVNYRNVSENDGVFTTTDDDTVVNGSEKLIAGNTILEDTFFDDENQLVHRYMSNYTMLSGTGYTI